VNYLFAIVLLLATQDYTGKSTCAEVVYPTAGDQLPRVRRKVEPEFPAYPKDVRKVWAKIIMEATVDTEGGVADVKTLSCKVGKGEKTLEGEEAQRYCPQFSINAENAVTQWLYEPALRGGKAVCVHYTMRVDFVSTTGGPTR